MNHDRATNETAQSEAELARVKRQLKIALETFRYLDLDIKNGITRDVLLRYLDEQRERIRQAGEPPQ